MRPYYIASGILLILPIIDFAVAAPALVKEKPQAGIDVINIPEDPITVLRKRGDELNELWLKFFGHPESHFLEKPESSSAAHPSSSSPPLGPTDGSMDVEQPLSSIPEEPLPVSSPGHAPPSPGDETNELWLKLFGHPESHFFGKPEESSAARPSSSSPPSEPADGWTDLKQPLSPIPEEPSPVSSQDHAPPSPGSLTGYELMKGDAPPGPSGSASSTADHELMGAHVLPNPGPSTDSGHEMVDVPPSSPVSSTNPDPQWMSSDSPSGKRKRPWLLMLT
jgi:hypothetical protein